MCVGLCFTQNSRAGAVVFGPEVGCPLGRENVNLTRFNSNGTVCDYGWFGHLNLQFLGPGVRAFTGWGRDLGERGEEVGCRECGRDLGERREGIGSRERVRVGARYGGQKES